MRGDGEARRWLDHVLGRRHDDHDGPEIAIADAVAELAVGGAAVVPDFSGRFDPEWLVFEATFALARTALTLGRDARRAVEQAFRAACTVPADRRRRDRALLWGAVALDAAGEEAQARRWCRHLPEGPFRHEFAAHAAAHAAHRGDFASAREGIAALPRAWDKYVDLPNPDAPCWLGTGAAAVAAAVAHPAVAATPEARLLLDAVHPDEAGLADWRRDGERRALALAWSRIGEGEHALQLAGSLSDGTRRADLIVDLLATLPADASAARLARWSELARGAMSRDALPPIVIADAGEDRAALSGFIGSYLDAEVDAALARLHLARGDRTRARALVDGIDRRLTIRTVAEVEFGCAQIAAGEATVAEVRQALGMLQPDSVGQLVEAALLAGVPELAMALAAGARFEGRKLAAGVEALLMRGRLDEATVLLHQISERIEPLDAVRVATQVVRALTEAGRPADAVALVRGLPPAPYPLLEQRMLAAGLWLAPPLVAAGETATARAWRDELHERLARTLGHNPPVRYSPGPGP